MARKRKPAPRRRAPPAQPGPQPHPQPTMRRNPARLGRSVPDALLHASPAPGEPSSAAAGPSTPANYQQPAAAASQTPLAKRTPTRTRKRSNSSPVSPSSNSPPARKKIKTTYAGKGKGKEEGEDKVPEVRDPRIITDPDLPAVPRPATPDLEAPIWEGNDEEEEDGIDITEEQQEKWLDWSYLEADPGDPKKKVEKKWKGIRVLGMGSQGIVGLFEKEINGVVKYVVVKQSKDVGADNKALKDEAALLDEIAARGAEHVVGILESYHGRLSRGTHYYDPMGSKKRPKLLGVVYLEFCDLGDMVKYMKKMYQVYDNAQNPLPEANIWRVFECLAKGLCMLESGREDLTSEKWNKNPIAHFDIKPENILVSSQNPDHPYYHIFKIGDLGMAVRLSAKSKIPQAKGTMQYFPPEMAYRAVHYNESAAPLPEYGTQINVWQIGVCMYELIYRGRSFDKKSGYHAVHMNINGNVVAFDAFGTEINRNTIYSATLRKLVIRCLARKAVMRPRPDEVLAICEAATAVVSSVEDGEPTIGERTAMQFWDPKWEKEYNL